MKLFVATSIIAVSLLQNVLFAQESKQKEKSAKSSEEAVEHAQENYLAGMEAALKLAMAEEKIDEAVHIRRVIEMEKLRHKLTNTTWTRNRPGIPATLHYHPNRRATTSDGLEGIWEVVGERTVIVQFSEDIFFHFFDEKTRQYRAKAFGGIRTNFKLGERVK